MDPPPSQKLLDPEKEEEPGITTTHNDDDDDDDDKDQQQPRQQLVLYEPRQMVDTATKQDTDQDDDESAAATAPGFFRRFLGPSPNAVLSFSFFARPEPLGLPQPPNNNGLLVVPPRVDSEQEEQDEDDPLAAPLLVPPPSHLSSSSSPWGRSPRGLSRSVKRGLVSCCAVVLVVATARWAELYHHAHSRAPPPAPVDRYTVLKTCLVDDLQLVPSEGMTEWFWNGPGRRVAVSPPCRWDSPLGTLVSLLELRDALHVGHASWNGQGRAMTEPEDVCRWKGVVCNDEPAVTGLYLNHVANLSGTLPPQLFGGSALPSLVRLELQDNAGLHGTIPSELGCLTQLERVYLHETNLSGTIPTTLGRLSRLEELLVDRTQLVGTMPDQICQLRRTARLANLHASCNRVHCNRQTCCTACHSYNHSNNNH